MRNNVMKSIMKFSVVLVSVLFISSSAHAFKNKTEIIETLQRISDNIFETLSESSVATQLAALQETLESYGVNGIIDPTQFSKMIGFDSLPIGELGTGFLEQVGASSILDQLNFSMDGFMSTLGGDLGVDFNSLVSSTTFSDLASQLNLPMDSFSGMLHDVNLGSIVGGNYDTITGMLSGNALDNVSGQITSYIKGNLSDVTGKLDSSFINNIGDKVFGDMVSQGQLSSSEISTLAKEIVSNTGMPLSDAEQQSLSKIVSDGLASGMSMEDIKANVLAKLPSTGEGADAFYKELVSSKMDSNIQNILSSGQFSQIANAENIGSKIQEQFSQILNQEVLAGAVPSDMLNNVLKDMPMDVESLMDAGFLDQIPIDQFADMSSLYGQMGLDNSDLNSLFGLDSITSSFSFDGIKSNIMNAFMGAFTSFANMGKSIVSTKEADKETMPFPEENDMIVVLEGEKKVRMVADLDYKNTTMVALYKAMKEEFASADKDQDGKKSTTPEHEDVAAANEAETVRDYNAVYIEKLRHSGEIISRLGLISSASPSSEVSGYIDGYNANINAVAREIE